MKERPIIFSSEMVQAILDGRKTMTRRLIKPQFPYYIKWTYLENEWWRIDGLDDEQTPSMEIKCPYGQPGDRLWVKETWTQDINIAEGATGTLYYRANENSRSDLKWKSPRFMPRWASRITLEIVRVRVERLQEISIEDVEKEGITVDMIAGISRIAEYWNSLYTKKPEYQWEANLWVWVVEFRELSLFPSEM